MKRYKREFKEVYKKDSTKRIDNLVNSFLIEIRKSSITKELTYHILFDKDNALKSEKYTDMKPFLKVIQDTVKSIK